MIVTKLFLIFILITSLHSKEVSRKNFSRIRDFTCAVAKDVLVKHPEMQTIALVELENNFPKCFTREILKCLPEDVAKVVMMPFKIVTGTYFSSPLSKSSMVIFVVDHTENVS
jgi:hypothetical protein